MAWKMVHGDVAFSYFNQNPLLISGFWSYSVALMTRDMDRDCGKTEEYLAAYAR
jgi:hypothetical protein